MRITRVEIENFRSIEKLALDTDKPVIVLEGRNDTGKSNIVLAIDVALRHAAHYFLPTPGSDQQGRQARVEELRRSIPPQWPEGLPRQNLVRRGATTARVCVTLDAPERRAFDGPAPLRVEVEITEGPPSGPAIVSVARPLYIAGPRPVFEKHQADRFDDYLEIAALLGRALRHVPTHRVFEPEYYRAEDMKLQWDGKFIKRLLFSYKNHENPEIQGRFADFLRACASPDLPIGKVFVGNTQSRNGNTSYLFARTERDGLTLDLEDRSSGVQQLVFLLALSVCHERAVAMIEEPELNLAEELQDKLWGALRGLVETGVLDQVWVTSHSEFFKRWGDRIVVTRPAGGWTEAASAPAKNVPALPFTAPLTLTNSGTVDVKELPPEMRRRLGVDPVPEHGGLLFVREIGNRLELLSEEDGLRATSPEATGK